MEFKTKPFAHQERELEARWNVPAWGLFWEQGTGKSKPFIDTAARLWEAGLIDGVLIVAPNGVHRNWVEQEIPLHLPDVVAAVSRVHCYQSSKAATKRHEAAVAAVTRHEGLAWLSVSYDALTTKAGHKALVKFITGRRLLYGLDEAQYIKNPTAERTKVILRSAKYAAFRRILTGTPIAQGPFDLYSEIAFLDADFWERHGLGSFTEFKHHFGEWTKMWNPTAFNPATKCRSGNHVDILKSYRRLPELAAMLKEITSRVTKDEVLDLPPKLYSKRFFAMTDEQRRHYSELREEYLTWLTLHPEETIGTPTGLDPDEVLASCVSDDGQPIDGESFYAAQKVLRSCHKCGGAREIIVEGMAYPCEACEGLPGGDTLVAAPLAMVRLLRLQQVTCGYLPTEDEAEPIYRIPGPNHRLNAVLDICEEAQHKVIVWARFKLDITLILEGLKERGIQAVRYDGEVSEEERAETKARFTGLRPVYQQGRFVRNDPVPEEEQAKVWVGNQAAGATGLTLTQAKTVIYYNNSFKLLDRLQSEDRAHRIGQTNPVLYIDLVAEDTVDNKIVDSLRTKKSIADELLGDRPKDWI